LFLLSTKQLGSRQRCPQLCRALPHFGREQRRWRRAKALGKQEGSARTAAKL